MSWDLGILDNVTNAAGKFVDAYTEREIEQIKPEPANTANEPKQNAGASVIKYDDIAAAQAAANQAEKANAATPKGDFLSLYGKWLAIGGGTIALLGVLVVVAKGSK